MTAKIQCWSCLKESRQAIKCSVCGVLQPLKRENAFSYLGVPISFDLVEQEFEKNFLDLQAIVHPDRYGGAHPLEKYYASEHSSFANAAYQILKNPIERARAILEIHGVSCDSKVNPELLMQAMERRETLESMISTEELRGMLEEMKSNASDLQQKIKIKFSQHQFNEIPGHLDEFTYLSKAISEAEQLLEKKA